MAPLHVVDRLLPLIDSEYVLTIGGVPCGWKKTAPRDAGRRDEN
jgi:hypothetical protein